MTATAHLPILLEDQAASPRTISTDQLSVAKLTHQTLREMSQSLQLSRRREELVLHERLVVQELGLEFHLLRTYSSELFAVRRLTLAVTLRH